MRAAMGGNLGALQCTHPRSDTRVQMLEEVCTLWASALSLRLGEMLSTVHA